MDFEDILKGIVSSTDNMSLNLKETCKPEDIWIENIQDGIQKIQTLTKGIEEKMAKLEKHCDKVQRNIYEQNKILKENATEIEKLELKQKNANDYFNSLRKEYEKQKQILLDLQKQLELNPHDEKTLTLARQKLELYKGITNIEWDYSVPIEVAAKGYARNKSKSYVHAFEYEKSKLTHKEIVDNMWTKIENSTEAWTDIIDMCSTETTENIQTNNE